MHGVTRNSAWRQANPARALLSQTRNSASKRKLECTITQVEVEELLSPMTCALTGVPLRWDVAIKKDIWAPSLDRIDNAVGYVAGNVRVVCWGVNLMRGSLTDAELVNLARLIVARSEHDAADH